jgi:hypothetical protein
MLLAPAVSHERRDILLSLSRGARSVLLFDRDTRLHLCRRLSQFELIREGEIASSSCRSIAFLPALVIVGPPDLWVWLAEGECPLSGLVSSSPVGFVGNARNSPAVLSFRNLVTGDRWWDSLPPQRLRASCAPLRSALAPPPLVSLPFLPPVDWSALWVPRYCHALCTFSTDLASLDPFLVALRLLLSLCDHRTRRQISQEGQWCCSSSEPWSPPSFWHLRGSWSRRSDECALDGAAIYFESVASGCALLRSRRHVCQARLWRPEGGQINKFILVQSLTERASGL